MGSSATRIQDKSSSARASVVPTTADPTKNGLVLVNADWTPLWPFLKLDQATPQTIVNWSPLMTGYTPTTDYMISTKKYVDDSSTAPWGVDTSIQYNNSWAFWGFWTWSWSVLGIDSGTSTEINVNTTNTASLPKFSTKENWVTTGVFQWRWSTAWALPSTLRVGTNIAWGDLILMAWNGNSSMFIDWNNYNVNIWWTWAHTGRFNVSKWAAEGIEFYPWFNAGVDIIQAYDRTAADYDELRFYAESYNFKIDWSTDALTILNNWNVGIGTAAPWYKLDVTGSINIAAGEAYTQNSLHILSIPSGSASSLVVWQTNFLGTGGNNISIGRNTLGNSGAGTSNTAIGIEAGFWQQGNNNVFIGQGCAYGVSWISNGSQNLGLGQNALRNLTTATATVALGRNSLYNLSSGHQNTWIGSQSLFKTTTTGSNTSIGTNSGYNNIATGNSYFGVDSGFGVSTQSTGNHNSAYGWYSLKSIRDGEKNCVFGAQSWQNISSGDSNCIFGVASWYLITSGWNNTLFGRDCGFSLTTQTGNVFIGYNVGRTNLLASNQLAIHNSDTATPLIYWEFNNRRLIFNCAADLSQLSTQPTWGTALAIATTQYSDIWENGVTGSRPGSPATAQRYFDTTLWIPVWYDGSNWIDAAWTTA